MRQVADGGYAVRFLLRDVSISICIDLAREIVCKGVIVHIVDVQNSVYAVCRLDHRGTENESAQVKGKRADDDKGCDTRDNTDCQFIVASFWRLERRGRWSVGVGRRGLVSCARIGRLRGRGGAGARLGLGARLACRRAGTVRGLYVYALRR